MPRHPTFRSYQRLTVYGRIAVLTVLMLTKALPSHAQQNLTWDANGVVAGTGGTGIWNTVSGTWHNGVTFQIWNNASIDNAIFSGTAGVVTLGGPITVQNITLSVTGYTVTGNTLTVAGVAPTISVTTGTATLNSTLAGTAGLLYTGAGSATLGGAQTYSGGLTKTGGGALTLTSNLNSYTGVTTINSGTLQIGAGGATGTLGNTSSVVNNATLQINRTGTITITPVISGSGSFVKANTGTVVLTADNVYTGATTISGGILQVGNAGTTGTIGSGTVAINGATSRLQFNRSDTTTVAQNISGTGGLFQVGSGTTILTGNNTYAGTTISAGTLQVGAGGTTGTVGTSTISIAAGGRLVVNRSDALTINGLITGAGSITQAGTGTTILTRTNTYTGSTIISAGTLQIGTGGVFGSLGTGAVINNGSLVFNRNGSENDGRTIAATISGTGTLTQAGTGAIWLTGTNSYTGATIISSGSLSLGRATTTGDLGASSHVVNNGTLTFDRTNDMTVTQAISGTGGLSKLGAAVTTLTGDNTYTGTTSVSAGTLRVGNGGSTGTLGTGTVLVSAGTQLAFDRNNLHVAGNIITGAGNLLQAGSGTTVLIGTVGHTGGTTISAGTLQIGNGGATGSIDGDVLNHGVLAFNRSGALTVGGNIAGTGSVVKEGTGVLTVTGTSSYSGATSVQAGTLLVNGSLGNTDVNVSSGATFGGTGTVGGAVTLASGTALTFGESPGTGRIFTVGALNISPTSVLDYTAAGNGVSDRVVVVGNLQLDGRVNIADAGGFGPGVYTLMTYGGTLADNGLEIGTRPANFSTAIQAAAGQVNLVVGAAAGGPVQFWAGGAPGVWSPSAINWTDQNGVARNEWGGQFAVFQTTPGVVTVDGALSLTGLQFRTDGFQIAGGSLDLGTSETVIRVDTGVTASISSVLRGPGGLVKESEGTLILSGMNSYTGGTRVEAGVLKGTASSLVGNIVNDATVVFDQTVAGVYAGTISGTGTLVKTGAGTLVLSGSNSYTGGTLVTGGVLQGDTDSIVGNIVNDAIVWFDQTGDGVYSGMMTGTGGLVKSGAGTLVLTGMNNYSGGTFVTEGVLLGNTLSLAGNIVNDAVVVFDQDAAGTYAGAMSGSGSLVKTGAGVLTLTGSNTFSGGTLVRDGTLRGNSASLQGAIVNDATVIFDQGFDGAYEGLMGGRGTLVKRGKGALLVTNANTYSGGTLIEEGSLAGNSGSLQGAIVNNATIIFDQAADAAFRGVLLGTGMLIKHGPGILALQGSHSQGTTVVKAGMMMLDGSLGGDVRVAPGATFTGSGSVGGAVTVAGDISTLVSPEGNPRELTVAGDVTLSPGSRYVTVVDPAGESSRLITPRHATIGDAIVHVDPVSGPYARVTHYSILSAAGGLSGQARASSSVAVLDPWATTTANDLVLTLMRTDVPLAIYAGTANGAAIGSVVDRLRGTATGDLAAVTRELTALTDAGLASALDVLAGEIHPSSVQLAALEAESIADLVREEIALRSSGAGSEGSRPNQTGSWTHDRHGWARLVTQRAGFDGGAAYGGTAALFGVAAGMDWTLRNQWLLGAGGSIIQGGMTVASLGAESDLLAPRGFGYVGYTARGWTINVGAAVAYHGYDTERPLVFTARLPARFGGGPVFGGIDRRATSQPSGVSVEGWSEVRGFLPIASWGLRPSAGIRTARYGRDAWQEGGADALSLSAPEQSVYSTQADAGVKLARMFGRFRPELSINYRRELRTGGTTQILYLVDSTAGLFRSEGLPLADETVMGRLGSSLAWRRIQMSFAYEVRRGAGQTRQTGQLGIGFD
jgi:fibronectin-binding autotransporter adhesin